MAKCRKCKKYDQKAKWCELIRRHPTDYDVDKVLDICAEVISKLPGLCERICPIGCDYGTEESCKESWRIYLEEQLKEGIKDVEKQEKKTKYDRIRSMTVEELAEFLCKVKADYQWLEHEFPSEEDCGIWEEWLQSEVESEKND